jgi:peptidoglycan/LPS O-acetylase OafA/YrhL
MVEIATRPRRRSYAYAACAGALGSGALRVYWAAGRGSGLPGDGVLGVAAGWGAATLCLLAAAGALATVAPWGRAIPRRVLLALAWSTCAALLLAAVFGLADGDVHWTGRANQVLCLAGGVLWFATARSYQRHTRGE